jgi:hypothetical protein
MKVKMGKVALALAVALILCIGSVAAFADTTDPFLNTYQDPDSTPYRTSVLNNGDDGYVSFLVSPSIAFDGPASFFSSQADADVVARSVKAILDDPVSLSAPTDITAYSYDIYDDGSWLVIVEVTFPTDGSVGSFSVRVENPLLSVPDNLANYSIIRNPGRPLPSIISADVWIVSGDIISTDHGLTVSFNNYSESVNRDFPTALDATFDASTDPGINLRASNFGYYDVPNTGVVVLSMEIDGIPCASNERIGWQYRVYRQYALSDPDSTEDVLTEYVGIDAIELLDGDIVYWVYGPYDSPSPLFPAYVTPRFPVPPVMPD